MSDQLPSIDNLPESELPSVDQFIIEEQELPSIEEFVEKEEEEIVEEVEEEIVAEAQDLTEVLRLISDVRKDIPDIPEIKYYDEELERLTEQVKEVRNSIPEIPEPPEIPEIKYYDDEIASLREEVKDLPEPKYYEEELEGLQNRIDGIKKDIVDLPEVKYYETDLESLKEDILAVKESIPVFPKWVNEVNQVPDFSWIGKTFGVIDDDFVKVHDNLETIRDRINAEVNAIAETIEVKEFESKNEFDTLTKSLTEIKDKIYKELRESALSINNVRHSFKDDDRKLKKNILSNLNVLKQRVEAEVKEFNRKNTDTKDIFDGYFSALTEEIANLPEVKYYDEDIKDVRNELNEGLISLRTLVEEIKGKQEVLKEEVNKRPIQPDPEESNTDPLTPTNQNFATHEDLAKHYKLFVNRVQQQLYTIGGGGAGFIKDLDDVSFDNTVGTNKLLIYNGSSWVGIASTALSGSTTLDEVLEKGNVSGIGMSVGVITATNGYFSGIVTASTINYDNVTDIYSTGIVTATKGIQVTGLGVHVTTAGVSTFVGLTSFRNGINVIAGTASTALIVQGDARITGILTIGTGSVTINGSDNKVQIGTGVTLTSTGEADFVGVVTAAGFEVGTAATIKDNGNATFSGIVTAANFIGDGSGLTGVANTDNVVSTTLSVSGVVTAIGGLYVGTAASIFANGNITGGIVTATKYYGDGSSLSNVTSTTINNNADNRLITGSGTANTLEGESTLTYDGAKLSVSTGATVFTNGNIAAAGIVTANGGFVGALTGAVTGNVTGNASGSSGSCTGNAATATALATTRAIGGVNFDGTAAINLPGVNASGTQDTSGNADTATTATTATNITVSANNSTDETVYPIFVDGATGGQGAESDTGLTYNPSDGELTATTFTGALTGNVTGNINGNLTGALQTAAQANVTSLGTLTTLTVDNVIVNGTTIGHTSDTDLMTLADGAITLSGQTNVGTAATLFANGNVTCGILTATSFVGNGSGLTNISGIPSESDTAVSSTSATSVYSVAHASYRSASLILQITQGSAYQSGRYMVIHDGTTATIVEESAVATGDMLGTFTAAISSSNLVVYVNMGSSSSATVTVLPTTVTV